jgi:hypothetical protein
VAEHQRWTHGRRAERRCCNRESPGFTDWFAALPGKLQGYLQSASDTVLGKFQEMADGAESRVSGMVGRVQGFIGDMAGTVEGLVSGLVGSVQGFISDMVGTVEGDVSGMVGSVQGFISDMVSTATGLAQDFYNAVVSKVQDTATDAASAAGTIASDIRDALADLYTIGYDAIMGLKNGIAAGFQSVYDTVVGWVNTISDALSKVHVPGFSPLDEAGFEMGQMFVGGIALGMGATFPQVAAALQSLGSLLADQANSIINANRDTFALSGSDIAQAMIDGITAKATSIGSAIAQVSDSVALALDKMQQDLIGKIDLARLSGASPEDIAKLQGQLNAVSQVLAGWAAGLGVTVTEAIDQINVSDQLVQQWQTALGNLNNVISGKAKDDLLATITDLNNELAVAVAAKCAAGRD